MDDSLIPEELKELNQWVGWRYEQRGNKKTKVPYQANKPMAKASSVNDKTWCSFEDAYRSIEKFDGVGFVFSDNDPFVGADLDACIDADTGVIDAQALHWIEQADSYCEVSPSGLGFHIFIRGTLPKGIKRKEGEIYSTGRFFTVTGECFNSVDSIRENQSFINQLSEFLSDDGNANPTAPLSLVVSNDEAEVVDTFERRLIDDFVHDPSCAALWNKVQLLPSQNEYDLAIASRAFMRGYSSNHAAELIYQHRCKWNENPQKAKRVDYMQATLNKASSVLNDADLIPEPEADPEAFMDMNYLANTPKRLEWLVKHYLPKDALVWLSGQWSTYKTFLALDIVFHVATGTQWQGNRVAQGKVLYVAGEGVGGLRKRLNGLQQHYGIEIPQDQSKVTRGAVFVNDPLAVAQFMANVKASMNEIDLLVLDTKSANMKGSDSDAATMNDWVNAIRRLQAQYKCTVLVVDHLNKQAGDSIRGSSQQDGAADAAYMLKRPDAESDGITLSTYKDPKDFERPEELHFMPQIIELSPEWNDEDGEAQSTLVLVRNASVPTTSNGNELLTRNKMSKLQLKAFELLKLMYSNANDNLVGTERTALIETRHWFDACNQDMGRNHLRTCRKLIEDQRVVVRGVHVLLK